MSEVFTPRHAAMSWSSWDRNGLQSGYSEEDIVIASRGKLDEDATEEALRVQSVYVGLVANKKRGQEKIGNLERRGGIGNPDFYWGTPSASHWRMTTSFEELYARVPDS